MLYSLNSAYPRPLPRMITLSDGRTRTDPSSFTPEEIADAGYVAAPDAPTYDADTERLTWTGSDWSVSAIPQEELDALQQAADEANTLSPAQFTYLLASTGLEAVWEAVEAHTKTEAPDTYALLRANSQAGSFRLARTLELLAQMKPLTDALATGVDLSEATIRAAWATAKAADF